MNNNAQSSNTNFRREKILIVDDEADIREMMISALVGAGYKNITEADSIDKALMAHAENPADIVFTDLTINEKNDGLKVLNELAPQMPDTVVVIVTGNTDAQQAIDCMREGAFDYLLKPFFLDDVVKVANRVAERRARMIELRNKTEEQLRVLGKFPSENPNPVLRIKNDGTLLYANAASLPLLQEWGIEVGDKVPEFIMDFIKEATESVHRKEIEVSSSGRVYLFSITPIEGEDYVYGHDITRLKEAEKELIRLKNQAQEMALHDALTGLPNRILLEDRLEQAIAHSIRNGTKTALVFIDLDKFKSINDTLGHKTGDEVLVRLAKYLKDAVRKTDTVARWGGDEMVLLLTDLQSRSMAFSVCERIRQQVQNKMKSDSIGIPVTLSMGIALYPDDSTDPNTLLQQADTALYVAKNRGRNMIVFFDDTDYVKTFQQKMHLGNLLRLAVDNDKIIPHYQPIIDVKTGSVAAVEALARWYDEQLGWIPPSTFIPMAEESGFIEELGEKVAKRAVEDLKRWRRNLNITVNLNVSLRQIFSPHFCDELLEWVKANGLLPEWITLEITESQAMIGSLRQGNPIEAAARAGFRLSIDDFGQGYSSLSSLQELSVHELKIDMKFVRNIKTEKGARIVQAIVELAHILGLQTVAEGVEQEEEFKALVEMGVDKVQGYYFARPMPAEEIEKYLLTRQSLAIKQ